MLKLNKEIEITRNIKLNPQSEKFIHQDYFKGYEGYKYKLVDELWDNIKGNCIIHMYPEEDTIGSDDELYGYESCLFFRTIIYNVEKMECYNFGLHDAVTLDIKAKVQNFKDMSTMITIYGGCKIGSGTDFTVHGLI